MFQISSGFLEYETSSSNSKWYIVYIETVLKDINPEALDIFIE